LLLGAEGGKKTYFSHVLPHISTPPTKDNPPSFLVRCKRGPDHASKPSEEKFRPPNYGKEGWEIPQKWIRFKFGRGGWASNDFSRKSELLVVSSRSASELLEGGRGKGGVRYDT